VEGFKTVAEVYQQTTIPGRIIPIYTRFGLTYLLKWSLNICGGVLHRTVSQNAHLKAAR